MTIAHEINKVSRVRKPLEALTIQDNFMFVKLFSNKDVAIPFLKAVLKVNVEDVQIVGESHLQSDPQKKYVRFDVMVKENAGDGAGRMFDIELQMVNTGELPKRARYYQGICDVESLGTSLSYRELREQYIIFLCPMDIYKRGRPIYEFENREKNEYSLTMGDHTYKYFLNFSKYESVTDESIRDYMRYFATNEVTSEATKNIQSRVDFYHNDPKTRSDYMTFKDMLDDERAEGREEGAESKNRELAKGFRDAGVSLDVIAVQTGLTIEEIKAL